MGEAPPPQTEGPPPRARASIVDVAARAGVSVATVSRALRALPNVSPATRERVLRAAEDLEYSASPLASGLVTGRMRSVGVVVPWAGRWFFAEVLRGMEEALRDRGYDLVLHVLADQRRRDEFFAGLPVRSRVDAVILVALPLSIREREILRGLGVPLACVAEPNREIHSECIDNFAAARLAVQHLVNLGHRRIAMIGGDPAGPERFTVPGARAAGYTQVLLETGLPVSADWQCDGGYTAHGGELAMTALLSRSGGRPTAVYCQSDEMAFGALHALRHSRLRCPDDVSIVGTDDHDLAETFEMTTVAQPVSEQGAAAARWVIGALDGDVKPVPAMHLHPVRLVLRGSTGPAAPEPAGADPEAPGVDEEGG